LGIVRIQPAGLKGYDPQDPPQDLGDHQAAYG
jgi:hypothetical protein